MRPATSRRHLFEGRSLLLQSVGMGYGKRITFKPDTLNAPENYFWSDSHPEGVGMEPRAVHPDMQFIITGNGVSVYLRNVNICHFWINANLKRNFFDALEWYCVSMSICLSQTFKNSLYINWFWHRSSRTIRLLNRIFNIYLIFFYFSEIQNINVSSINIY